MSNDALLYADMLGPPVAKICRRAREKFSGTIDVDSMLRMGSMIASSLFICGNYSSVITIIVSYFSNFCNTHVRSPFGFLPPAVG